MNKTLLLITFFSFLLTTSVKAQKFNPSNIKVGLIAGVNGSVFSKDVEWFSNTNTSGRYSEYEENFRPALLVGLTAQYRLTTTFTPSIELLYEGSGMRYRAANGVVLINSSGSQKAYNYFNYNVNYFKIPLLANYQVSHKSDEVNWFLYGGIAPCFSLKSSSAVHHYYSGSGSGSPFVENDYTGYSLEDLCAFNADIISGIKCNTKSGVVIGLRANYTMLPVFKYSSNENGNLDTRIVSCSINAGFVLK